MVSSPPTAYVLPADVYVQLARACEEVQVETLKGSGTFARAKRCCFCARVVKLGSGCSDYSLQQHMTSYRCQAQQKQFADSGCDLPLFLPKDKSLDQILSLQPSDSSKASAEPETTPNNRLPAGERTRSSFVFGDADGCPGALVEYPMSMFSHYPWHLHDSDFLDYKLSYIDPNGKFFCVQSNKCLRTSPRIGASCHACSQVVLGWQYQDLVKRACSDVAITTSTNLHYWTHSQLCNLVKEKTSKLNNMKMKDMTSQRRIQSLCGRMDDQKRLMLAIAQSDEASVGRIVRTALENGAGVETIIGRIVKAQEGLFSPRNYSEKAFDLIALVLRIGGPRLAFAVAKAMHLPSISTVRNRLDLPRLLPSIGFPTSEEVLKNIKTFFAPNASGGSLAPPLRAGVTLLIDELAVEDRPHYSVHQDAITGICREHADVGALAQLSTRSDALKALLDTQTALDSGQCHRAFEATMAAIARFGRTDYNATVILASGTCKTETVDDQKRWIELLLECWEKSPYGEVLHGLIWSICTDGDPKRRRALFMLCMTSRVSESSGLFCLIGHLPLLNLCCGPKEIIHDGDYKHEEKRLASALRSHSGLLVNGAHITPRMLVRYLRSLEELPESRILSLFNGTDPQNVPKASALLSYLYQASQLPSIASATENKPFVLLGEVLGSFVRPFTIPTMTLDEQITSLAKCGHLIFALYRIDGAKFLPGQLVYDIQTSIKNAVFCVAKTQLVDPTLPFYLLQTGTDRLKNRFGTYRTTTSNRNGDLQQMCDRAAGAQHIDEIFSLHPSWNRTPYRLSLDGKSGVDHTNPASWVGDVIVGNVDLRSSWLCGQAQAARILSRAGVPFEFDPSALQSESSTIDLMRPTGSYPGIQVDTLELNLRPVSLAELTDDVSPADTDPAAGSIDLATNDTPTHSESGALEHDINAIFPSAAELPSPGTSKRGWLQVDDTWVPLESAARYLFTPGGGAKSADRLRRICGYTRYLRSEAQSDTVLGDFLHVSDLVGTFLSVNHQLVLAIARVSHIAAKDGRSLEAISEDEFHTPGITLSGQVLELCNTGDTWYWTQRYDSVSDSTSSTHRKRHIGFDFDARFCRPVNPVLIERQGEQVWSFDHTQMEVLMDELWRICGGLSPKDNIPTCEPSATFPYHTSSNQNILYHLAGTKAIKLKARPSHEKCHHCGETIAIKSKMRMHIGQHLLVLRSSLDATRTGVMADMCGFCGRAGTCTVRVEPQRTGKGLEVVSDCSYRDKFSYAAAAQSSKTSPCTNRPVACPLCSGDRCVWSYGLKDHILAVHPAHQLLDTTLKDISKYEPLDQEYDFMKVDRESGLIQVSKRGKRKQGAEVHQPGAAKPRLAAPNIGQ
ncbi:hypothetical protein RhiJN_15022 [Ceratobasidium sp. AG-Ba]|nr:hypothetical protein RhiJN_15022 [Ceratobasidium sp. AG-Ba]